jgi:hypothetical protein
MVKKLRRGVLLNVWGEHCSAYLSPYCDPVWRLGKKPGHRDQPDDAGG